MPAPFGKKKENTVTAARGGGGHIFAFEARFLRWAGAHLIPIGFVGITLLSLLMRYTFRDFASGDASVFLLPWYEQIRAAGGIAALKEQVGDYNILYQFVIALFTYLPIRPLYAYKLFSVVFDYLLAAAVSRIVYRLSGPESRGRRALTAYTVVICSPLVMFNSALWAQCDAVYTFFCVTALYCLLGEDRRYLAAFILYGVAVTFKLQAVFILPLFLYVYFTKREFSALYFLIVPLMMLLLSLPGLLMGRSILEPFTIYFGQVSEYQRIGFNFPTFWFLFRNAVYVEYDELYYLIRYAAVALTVVVLGMHMLLWYQKKIPLTLRSGLCMAFLCAYTCVLLLPAMHERYGFLCEILAVPVLFFYPRTLAMFLPLYLVSVNTYAFYLFGRDKDLTALAAVYLIVYAAYAYYLTRKLLSEAEHSGTDAAERAI